MGNWSHSFTWSSKEDRMTDYYLQIILQKDQSAFVIKLGFSSRDVSKKTTTLIVSLMSQTQININYLILMTF